MIANCTASNYWFRDILGENEESQSGGNAIRTNKTDQIVLFFRLL